jgi:hypothetical protein
MNDIKDPRFFTAGDALFTVKNNKGDHYTYSIVTAKDSTGKPKPTFVGLLTGPDNTSSYTYIGILDHDTNRWSSNNPFIRRVIIDDKNAIWLTPKSKYTVDTVPVRVLRWAIKSVITGSNLPEGYSIQHEGKCCCCGRTLTTPESIDAGIGPICAQKEGW